MQRSMDRGFLLSSASSSAARSPGSLSGDRHLDEPNAADSTPLRTPKNALGGQLTDKMLAELHWVASEGSPSLSRHARIILARQEGRSLSDIAQVLDVDRATVRRWLRRFDRYGLRGLVHASTGRSRKRRFGDSVRDAVARLAMAAPPAPNNGKGAWSLRRLRTEVLRRGIIPQISVEGLRQLLRGLPLPDAYWRRGDEAMAPLSGEVRQGLETLAQTARPDVGRRARIVLARSRGLTEAEIASALSVGRSCVRRWLHRFRHHGILGLQLARRPSHPLVFTADIRATIVAHARMRPEQFGFAAPDWSLRSLRTALIQNRVVPRISIQHLGRILAEAGLSLHGTPASVATRTPASR